MALLTSPVHPTASNGRVSLQQMRLDAKILCREEAAIGRKLSRNAALDEVSKKNGYASWHHATCHAEVKQSHSTANDAKTTEVVSIERATRVAKIGKSLSKFLEDVCNSNEIVFDGLHYCRITGGYNRSKSFAFACGRVAFMFYLGTEVILMAPQGFKEQYPHDDDIGRWKTSWARDAAVAADNGVIREVLMRLPNNGLTEVENALSVGRERFFAAVNARIGEVYPAD